VNLLDLAPQAAQRTLERWIDEHGERRYRARQIHPRLWKRPVESWQQATDLPTSLRTALTQAFPLPRPTLRTQQRSGDGTIKYLWALDDGALVESVLIPEGRRRTLCISSQAGCAFGCAFCATGRITVSTVGLIPQLEQLAARPEQFRVALSLHAATSSKRMSLVPVERKYPLSKVLDVLERFPRRVTFEYVMIQGVNDADDDADALVPAAQRLGAHVNLLPLHPGGAEGLTPTAPGRIDTFADRLRGRGVNVTVRMSRGLDIAAACGQLRTEFARRANVAAEVDADIE
jgi:adenine C2-methylase RlmN of 23S rRNA A2503 and tRNA A37